MTLPELNRSFSTDEDCREILTRLRWPEGVECPRCCNRNVWWVDSRKQFTCSECSYQFSVTTGTIFNDSHLALPLWFMAVLLIVEAKKGMSASQLKRTMWGQHKGSYKTAWYLCHRIRSAMTEVHKMLDGTIEVDEMYVGGRVRGKGQGPRRGDKQVVIGIIKRDGELKFVHVHAATSATIRYVMQQHVSEDVDVIVTDESTLYASGLTKTQSPKRKTVHHKSEEYVRYEDGFMVTTNTIESAFSLFKRGVIGSWHRVSPKHLAAYLNEMTFRFNRRKRPDLFLDTLRHMVTAPTLTFEKLTA
jgi:transposase-like protein